MMQSTTQSFNASQRPHFNCATIDLQRIHPSRDMTDDNLLITTSCLASRSVDVHSCPTLRDVFSRCLLPHSGALHTQESLQLPHQLFQRQS